MDDILDLLKSRPGRGGFERSEMDESYAASLLRS
jgi:hypothetical protein